MAHTVEARQEHFDPVMDWNKKLGVCQSLWESVTNMLIHYLVVEQREKSKYKLLPHMTSRLWRESGPSIVMK